MIFYRILDLPPLPEEFLHHSQLKEDTSGYNLVQKLDWGYDHYLNGQLCTPSASRAFDIKHPDYESWCQKNLPFTGYKKIYVWSGLIDNPAIGLVHHDTTGKIVLNYIYDTGGDNVQTSWYIEKDRPLLRNRKPPGTQSDTGHVKYDDLTVLEQTVFEKNTWVLMRVDVLHDIRYITGNRSMFQIRTFDQSVWNRCF